ncbi:MAG TPA: methyltransferase domain-containing protein [Tabrizicola sp.]|nr:methyltransferase domain-containing protein [Tabrizicola sp.]
MPLPPPLVDLAGLARQRHRARSHPGHEAALFLHRLAADDLQERLLEVNRRFTNHALIAGFSDFWRGRFAEARVLDPQDALPFAPGAQDLVIHALALHWANDPLGQLIQCRRALKPDGLFLGVMFGGQTLQELRASLAEAEAQVAGGLSPRVLPMGEIRDLGALMQRAGFALPVADSVTQTVHYPDFAALMSELRAMGETNALAARPRHFTRRTVLTRAEAIYHANFPAPDGRITATFELVFLTGWAPHESQQQPLRPGSAKARLADALSVPERPLNGD